MLKVDAFMLVGFCGGFTSYSACVVSLETAVATHEILTGALALSTFVLAPFAAALGMHLMVRYPDQPVPT
jgi:fluoride ion exporter CrcB/FEX